MNLLKHFLNRALLCSLFAIVPCMAQSQTYAQSLYYNGVGRIAVSCDGNMHDNDDMQATMMNFMILAHADLQSKTPLYIYADHIWGNEDNDLELMHFAAQESARRFGFKKTKLIAAIEQPELAYNAMCDEILKSTPENPLFIVAAGPMHVVGTALERAASKNPNALKSVTVISHSEWNNRHSDAPHIDAAKHHDLEPAHSGWTWLEMKEAFGDKVLFNQIVDQNGIQTAKGMIHNRFKANMWEDLAWMKYYPDKNVQWLLAQARTHPCLPDFSDSGMVYYLCADLDNVRGDQNGNFEKLRIWMDAKHPPLPAAKIKTPLTVLKNGKMLVGDEFIAFEAEATDSPLGAWKLQTPADADYDKIWGRFSPINNTYLEYTGGNVRGSNIARGTDELQYKFTPKTSGKYTLTGRMAQRLTVDGKVETTDLCNDVFVKMSGDYTSGNETKIEVLRNWNKFFGNGTDAWGSFVRLDIHHKKFIAAYNLEAGKEYTLHVSGRSQRCCIDYFLLTKAPIVLKGRLDLATSNAARYIPQFDAASEFGFNATFNAVDFEKFTDMGEGFANATIDKRRNALQMPHRLATGAAETVYNGPDAKVDVNINTMLEQDGESQYTIYIDGKKIGSFTNESIYGTNVKDYTIKKQKVNKRPIKVKNGSLIRVEFNSATNGKVPEGNLTATSRGRWQSIELITVK